MEATSTSQVALSKELGLSPQNLSLILRGTNCPNSETTLQIIEIIEPETMRTDYIDPRATPRQSAGNPGPKTLTEARDRIADLETQLLQLRGSAPPANPVATSPATPGRIQAPAPIKTGNIVENRGPAEKAPVKKALPPEANTPVLVQRIIDVTPLVPDLLSMLANPVHSPMQRAVIYAEVKKRRALEGV
jgi:hypothetical protein